MTATGAPVHARQRSAFTLYDSLRVVIDSEWPVRDFVLDYFWPHCRPADAQTDADVTIRVRAPADESVAVPSGARRIALYEAPDGFVPDYNNGLLWEQSPSERIVLNPHTGTRFEVEGDEVVVTNADPLRTRIDLCRVIKQLVATGFESRGRRVLHASGVAVGDRAIVFVGPKGAGKTTLAGAAVELGARFIANDRLFIDASTPSWNVRGWSDPIRLVAGWGEPKKERVPLRTYFAGAADRVVVGEVPVAMVVLPGINGAARVTLVEVEMREAFARLSDQLLPSRRRWLGIERHPSVDEPVAPRSRALSVAAPYADAKDAVARVLEELE